MKQLLEIVRLYNSCVVQNLLQAVIWNYDSVVDSKESNIDFVLNGWKNCENMGELAQQLLSRTLNRRALQKDLRQQEEAFKTLRHHKRRSAAVEVSQYCFFVILLNKQMVCL